MAKSSSDARSPNGRGATTFPFAVPTLSLRLWAVLGTAFGAFAIYKMDLLGKVLGAGILLLGLRAAWRLWQFAQRGTGSIEVGPDTLRLPTGTGALANAESVAVPWAEVKTAYFLHHSVPRRMAAPVLVIETTDGAHAYPRDYFETEVDARRLLAAVLERAESSARQ